MKKQTKDAFTTVICVCLFLWCLTFLAALGFTHGAEEARPGLIGDTFGALNALISIFGFAAIVYTIQKEHEDDEADDERHAANLNLQRELLELQQGVLNTQKQQSELEAISLNIRLLERNAELLMRTNHERSDLFREWCLTIHSMRHAKGIPANQWAATKLNDPESLRFLFGCRGIYPDFDVEEDASEAAAKVFQAYTENGTKDKQALAQLSEQIKRWSHRLTKASGLEPPPGGGL